MRGNFLDAKRGMGWRWSLPARHGADGVWLTLQVDREAGNEALADCRSEVVEVRVRAALVPQRLVLLACGRRGERKLLLRLRHGAAKQIADVVLVDGSLEAQLTLVIEERTRCAQLNGVALLAREVEDRE